MYQISIFTSLFFLLPILLFIKRFNSTKKLNLPPSPPKLPIIGNLHQIGSLPHLSLHALAKKYGDIMLLQLGQLQTIVVSSPEMAKQVMKDHDVNFASRPHSKIAMLIFSGSYDIAFAPYGEYWRQTRKLCTTHLLSARMVQSFQHVKEEEVKLMMEEISELSSSTGVVNMSEVLESFASNVIARVVSDKFSGSEDRKATLSEVSKEEAYLLGAFQIAEFFPMLGWLDISGLYSRAKRNAKKWNAVLYEVINEQAKCRLNENKVTSNNSDFVDVLLALENDSNADYSFTRKEIKSILQDMFAAGIDTTNSLLEHTMAELVRNPKVMKKLQTEVRSAARGKDIIRDDDLSKMSYVKAVIKEALRLHPPAPLLLPRESAEPCELAGYHIPKKTRVIVNAWAIGRDPKIWEKPDEFIPERFIGSSIEFKGSNFEFIPFGAGRRICPGINFAVSNIEFALANLVNKFDWALPSNMLKDGLNMDDKFGVVVSLAQRLDLVATQVQVG